MQAKQHKINLNSRQSLKETNGIDGMFNPTYDSNIIWRDEGHTGDANLRVQGGCSAPFLSIDQIA